MIRVDEVNYGRTSASICTGGPVKDTACFSNQTRIVGNLCNGKSLCNLTAPTGKTWRGGPSFNNLFRLDPCAYTYKYLNVTYTCISN